MPLVSRWTCLYRRGISLMRCRRFVQASKYCPRLRGREWLCIVSRQEWLAKEELEKLCRMVASWLVGKTQSSLLASVLAYVISFICVTSYCSHVARLFAGNVSPFPLDTHRMTLGSNAPEIECFYCIGITKAEREYGYQMKIDAVKLMQMPPQDSIFIDTQNFCRT